MIPVPEAVVERSAERVLAAVRIGTRRFPFLADHRAGAGIVFPAVYALDVLARAARLLDPAAALARIENIALRRFLVLPESGDEVEAFAEVVRAADGSIAAALFTTAIGKGGIRRRVEHVTARFHPRAPFDSAQGHGLQPKAPSGVEGPGPFAGVGFPVSGQRLYAELVPFGPAFHAARGLYLYPEGVTGWIASSGGPHADGLLGDPFVLDSAMHLACAWCQRYRGIVGFPVGIDALSLPGPPVRGEACLARLDYTGDDGDAVLFDLAIVGADGRVALRASGLRMADVSRGASAPPAWVRDAEDPAPDLAGALGIDPSSFAIFEIDAVTDWSRQMLTPDERTAMARMQPRRARTFLASRWAKGRLPGAPVSVAHDARFVVAARGEPGVAIGVDVESLDGRALRVARAFLSDDERAILVSPTGLTPEEAAVRAWSAKECYGKALGVGLGKVIENARIRAIGVSETCIEDHQRPGRAVVRHAAAVGHLFSLLGIEQTPRNAL